MTPSERVNILQKIARRLSVEDWPILDLTLRQFGLPYSDTWSGDKIDYVLTMVEKSDDPKLISLYNHLGFDEDKQDTSDIRPSFWQDGTFRLFISHLAEYKEEVGNLKSQLEKYGITCFVAHRDIEPLREWQNEIELGLKTCDALIALMRPGFHASKWTDQEIGYAMGRGVLVFSVRMGEDPYGFIGKFQAISFVSWEKTHEQIFDILVNHKRTAKNMARALVSKFLSSKNYVSARELMGYIEKVQYWDSDLEKTLLDAPGQNSQIGDAYGIPFRIKTHTDKWRGKGT